MKFTTSAIATLAALAAGSFTVSGTFLQRVKMKDEGLETQRPL
jgi:hypothetical protein